MKPCKTQLLLLLNNAQGTDAALQVANCYAFQLSDGTTFRITDFDSPISIAYPSFNGPLLTIAVHSGGGGSAYSVGDSGTIGGAGIGGQYLIASESGGAATGLTLFASGNGYANANGVATTATSGAGSGLTLDVTAITDARTGTVTFSADASVYPLPDKQGIKMKWGLGVEVDTLTMRLDAGPSITIDDQPILQLFTDGGMDNALVQIERTYNPTQGTGGAYSASVYGTIPLFQGNVSDITAIGRSYVEFEIKDRREKLNVPMPYNVYQPGCRWPLYGTGCTLVKASYGVTGNVASGSGALQLNITGPTQASGYFDQGTLLFTSGVNSGQEISLRSYVHGSPNVVLLYEAAPNTPNTGDGLVLYPGCDKTYQTCVNKFSNGINFSGMPYIPVPETSV